MNGARNTIPPEWSKCNMAPVRKHVINIYDNIHATLYPQALYLARGGVVVTSRESTSCSSLHAEENCRTDYSETAGNAFCQVLLLPNAGEVKTENYYKTRGGLYTTWFKTVKPEIHENYT